ncbi:MAG: hypothetical protein D6B25_19850 [Desulfobulbaceae bacterium]|nr:MAG: hypothetical protein D6B25_19850 [Desulfobulbaceae bacterium]
MKSKNKNTWAAKLKRTVSAFLKVDPSRSGECQSCGACCILPVRCLFLIDTEDGKAYCSIYAMRPLNCRKYPRTQKEWITSDNCSFQFSTQPDTR